MPLLILSLSLDFQLRFTHLQLTDVRLVSGDLALQQHQLCGRLGLVKAPVGNNVRLCNSTFKRGWQIVQCLCIGLLVFARNLQTRDVLSLDKIP